MHGLYEAEKQNMQDIRASSLKRQRGVIENVKKYIFEHNQRILLPTAYTNR